MKTLSLISWIYFQFQHSKQYCTIRIFTLIYIFGSIIGRVLPEITYFNGAPLNSSKILTLPGTACFQLGRLEPTKNSGWLFQGFTCPLQAGLIKFHGFVEILSSRIIETKITFLHGGLKISGLQRKPKISFFFSQRLITQKSCSIQKTCALLATLGSYLLLTLFMGFEQFSKVALVFHKTQFP